MIEVEAIATANQLRLVSERQYVYTNLGEVKKILTSLAHRMKIVEEITKNWNRMQQELTTINTEMVVIHNAQVALRNLMEGVAHQLEELDKKEHMCEGLVKQSTRPDGNWGGFGETQSFWTIITRVGTIEAIELAVSVGGIALETLATNLPQWGAPMLPPIRLPKTTFIVPPSPSVL